VNRPPLFNPTFIILLLFISASLCLCEFLIPILVPKLSLGTRITEKLCFRWRRCSSPSPSTYLERIIFRILSQKKRVVNQKIKTNKYCFHKFHNCILTKTQIQNKQINISDLDLILEKLYFAISF